jgi:hypothetical protein
MLTRTHRTAHPPRPRSKPGTTAVTAAAVAVLAVGLAVGTTGVASASPITAPGHGAPGNDAPGNDAPGNGSGHAPGHGPGPRGGVLPASANGAWAYDTGTAGAWVSSISSYNAAATSAAHRLTQVFSYATDMEMYCPDNDASQCTPSDLQSYYTPTSSGWASTLAYYNAFDATSHTVSISPIIDGRTDAGGYLTELNQLSPSLAATFADKVAAEVCADPRIDGIQFDIEPFDVTTKNGQYYFYQQIAKDFAGQHSGSTATDPYGCVGATHPSGRYFSVFTFAASIKPGTAEAANVAAFTSAYHNAYVIDSLYDLGSNPAGSLNDLPVYKALVVQQADEMKTWADREHIPYGFGIPASASAHEYETCTGSCAPGADGSTGNPMIDYAQDAVTAIDRSGAPADRLFLGTNIWDFGNKVSSEGATVTPAPAPSNVLRYLDAKLPG